MTFAPEFGLGDTIEFTVVKRIDGMNEFQQVSGEVVELPTSQRHLPHLVCIKLDSTDESGKHKYRNYKRADMIAPLVLILG